MGPSKHARYVACMARRSRTTGATPPDKICETCGRPFSWRKKWAKDWDRVRYCSKACRAGRNDPRFTPR